MGLFNKIFGQSESSSLAWSIIQNEEDLDQIIKESQNQPCVIFKHSTRCSISSMALSRFEKGWNPEQEVKIYYLDLIRYRSVSDLIAERLHVHHQSPQVIVVKNGNAVYNASHNAIDPKIISQQ